MTRRRYEITNRERSIIALLLPNKPRGVPRVDDHRVLNGMLWQFRTESPQADEDVLPSLRAQAKNRPAGTV